jgi:hypothetical protein
VGRLLGTTGVYPNHLPLLEINLELEWRNARNNALETDSCISEFAEFAWYDWGQIQGYG